MEWFEDLGFFDNPLGLEPLKSDSETKFFDKEFEDLLYRVKAGSIVVLQGHKGTGKTQLLKGIINNFKGKIIYVNASTTSKRVNIESLLRKKYGFLKRLTGKIPKNMVLLLDDVNKLTRKNCERIKFYFDQGYLRSAVLTTNDYENTKISGSLRDRIGNRLVTIPKLNFKQSTEILKDKFSEYEEYINENELSEVFKASSSIKEFFMKLSNYMEKRISKGKELSKKELDSILSKHHVEYPNGVLLCNDCKTKLENIKEEWLCPKCDTYCTDCGTKVEMENDQCAGCEAIFEN